MHSPQPPGYSGLFCGAGLMPADGPEDPSRCAVPTRAGRDKPGPTGWPACQSEACAWASRPDAFPPTRPAAPGFFVGTALCRPTDLKAPPDAPCPPALAGINPAPQVGLPTGLCPASTGSLSALSTKKKGP